MAALRPSALTLLAALAAGCVPYLHDDLEEDPTRNGWTVEPPRPALADRKEGEAPPPPKANAGWLSGDARSGTRSLAIGDGALLSPDFGISPLAWCRVRFAARADGPAFCAMMFEDFDGWALEAAYTGIEPSATWTDREFCFRVRSDAERARLRFQPIDRKPLRIDDVLVERIGRDEVLAWADALYAAMPPLAARPPADRGEQLPKTRERLRDGDRLRIVMLGDSIVHDTANSPFDLLLERRYPGARVEVVVSVMGGKGCWYYRTGLRVKRNVLRHRPDLLVIGGISHKEDVEAIREVIKQVRAGSDCEILVMSGAVGPETLGDPRKRPDWRPDPDPAGEAYRDRLQRLAFEEQVAFFDFEGMWGRYIRDCGKPYAWFLRDSLHANARGMQILARILESYFSPPDPPPPTPDPES